MFGVKSNETLHTFYNSFCLILLDLQSMILQNISSQFGIIKIGKQPMRVAFIYLTKFNLVNLSVAYLLPSTKNSNYQILGYS